MAPNKAFLLILLDYPCLWDENHFNYYDIHIRRQAKLDLLRALNLHSPTPYTTKRINEKLKSLRNRKFTTLKKLVARRQEASAHMQASHAAEVMKRLPNAEDTTTPNLPEPQHSDSKLCRFCGKYSTACVYVTSDMPYIVNNKMVITLNSLNLNLDFDVLPQTVCHTCDEKLNDIFNYLNQVNTAQKSIYFKKVDEENQEEIESIIIKSETELQSHEHNEDSINAMDDSVTISETEFVKHTLFNHITRNNSEINKIDAGKNKKRKVTEEVIDAAKKSKDTATNPPEPPDPPSMKQCRFCGEFTTDCVKLKNKPYIENNRMAITLNGLSLHLDFSNNLLPQAVCPDCDEKLQDIYNFINQVKAAQEFILLLKKNVDNIDPERTKATEAVDTAKKQNNSKVTETTEAFDNTVVEINEQVTEKDVKASLEAQIKNEEDTRPEVKPSEVELRNPLLNLMAMNYQIYRS